MNSMKIKSAKLALVCFLILILCASAYWAMRSATEHSRIQELRDKADAGDSASQLLLGERYLSERNYEESIYWLKKAADQGSDQAINRLGLLAYLLAGGASSEEDKGLSLDLERSLEKYRVQRPVIDIYKDELSAGDLERLYSIGEIYFFGEGAERDYSLAREYFERSSAANTEYAAESEFRLGEIYFHGLGVSSNKAVALKWFEKSCERPNMQACEKISELKLSTARPK